MKIQNLLFYITKSTNKNSVIYVYQCHADKTLDVLNPIKAYWAMREVEGNPTEDLTFIEAKMAYGYSVNSIDDETVEFNITPLKEHTLTIKKRKDKSVYSAFIELEGKEYILKKVFVQLEEGVMMDSVQYLKLYLEDPETGEVSNATILHEDIDNSL